MGRILFVVNQSTFFLSHRLILAEAASRRGWEVHVATPPDGGEGSILGRGLQWHPIRLSRSGMNPLVEILSLYDLHKLYRALQPDLVHHVTAKPVLYGTIIARLTKVPAVVNAITGMGHVFIAGGGYGVMRRVLSAAYRLSFRHPRMKFIFQNADDQKLFVEAGWISGEGTVVIRGSGVDVELFRPAERYPLDDVVVVILHSRMLTTKGIVEFVNAARRLKGKARFFLVGPTDSHNPAAISAKQLQIWQDEGIVEYYGERSDIASLLREAHIGCLPSHREGLPKSLLEVAATGLPIVTTDVIGCREVVEHGKNGFLVPKGDEDALTDALSTLIENRGLRRVMGTASRHVAVTEFSTGKVILETMTLYESLTSSIHSPHEGG